MILFHSAHIILTSVVRRWLRRGNRCPRRILRYSCAPKALLPPAAERVNAPPNRGQILEFNRQVPLSRPLFDGFGDEDEAVVKPSTKTEVKKTSAVRTVVHDRLPNGWVKKAIKRTSGKRKGFWDVFLVTPDQKVLKTAQDLKL